MYLVVKLVGGFPDAIDGFRNGNVVWVEGFVDSADLLFDAIIAAGTAGGFVDCTVEGAITATVDAVNLNTNTIAEMLAGGASERFGLGLGGIVGIT